VTHPASRQRHDRRRQPKQAQQTDSAITTTIKSHIIFSTFFFTFSFSCFVVAFYYDYCDYYDYDDDYDCDCDYDYDDYYYHEK
jgi:hypothetical protein